MTELVDIAQLDSIRAKFTDLGSAVAELAAQNTELLDNALSSMTEGFGDALHEVLQGEGLKESAEFTTSAEAYVGKVGSAYASFADKLKGSGDSLVGTLEKANNQFSSLSGEVQDALQTAGMEASERVKGAKGKEADDKKKKPGLIKRTAIKEVKAVWGKKTRLFKKFSLPQLGSIGATALGIMAHGYLTQDRVDKEAGEVKNILIAAYDDGIRGAVDSATKHYSTMQEKLQKHYGIQRTEIQNVLKAFSDGGVSATQMRAKMGVDIDEMEDELAGSSLALDKMFNLAGGTSAKSMTKAMAMYGHNTKEAHDSVQRLYMLGRDSGIGAMQFAKNVETAAESLAKYGFDIDNVIDVTYRLQKGFEGMNVPKQFAGRQAALGMQQIASGMEGMGMGWQIALATHMGLGHGIQGRQALLDAFARVADDANSKQFVEFVEGMYQVAMQAARGDESKAFHILETGFGLQFQGAKAAMEIHKLVKGGQFEKAAEVAEGNAQIFKNAILQESEAASQFDLLFNRWQLAVAKLGQGMLSYAMESLAWLIGYFKNLPAILGATLKGDRSAAGVIYQELDELFGHKQSIEKMKSGLSESAELLKEFGADAAGDSLGHLMTAINTPLGDSPPVNRGLRSGVGQADWAMQGASPVARLTAPQVQGLREGGGEQVMPMDVPRPSGQGVTESRPPGQGSSMSPGFSGTEVSGGYSDPSLPDFDWVGGGLVLTASSPNTEGDLVFEVTGNCPRCGFVFGDAEEDIVGSTKSEPASATRRDSTSAVGGRPLGGSTQGVQGTSMPPIQGATTPSVQGTGRREGENIRNGALGGDFNADDREALARMIYSEVGPWGFNKPGGNMREQGIAAAWTVLNRMKNRKGGLKRNVRGAGSLHDLVTGGRGYGKQGGGDKKKGVRRRDWATKREASDNSRRLADQILKGDLPDNTKGSTMFYHVGTNEKRGRGYGDSKKVMPDFATNKRSVNVANIGGSKPRVDKGEQEGQVGTMRLYREGKGHQADSRVTELDTAERVSYSQHPNRRG